MNAWDTLRIYRETILEIAVINGLGPDITALNRKELWRLNTLAKKLKEPAESIVMSLKSRMERLVLTGYYLEGLSVKQTAVKYHYSYGYLRAVKSQALKRIAEMDK